MVRNSVYLPRSRPDISAKARGMGINL
jgi:hypothetical protein